MTATARVEVQFVLVVPDGRALSTDLLNAGTYHVPRIGDHVELAAVTYRVVDVTWHAGGARVEVVFDGNRP